MCIAPGDCPLGATNNGQACCEDGATSCETYYGVTTSTACGNKQSGTQVFLNASGQCVAQASCPTQVSTALASGNVCCADPLATACKGADSNGSTAWQAKSFVMSGRCAAFCGKGGYYSASSMAVFAGAPAGTGGQCVGSCPVQGASFSSSYAMTVLPQGTSLVCCDDPNAQTCASANAGRASNSVTCVGGYTLDTVRQVCVKLAVCAGARADDGVGCCPDGATKCSASLVPSSCGMNAVAFQTYLTGGTCARACPNGSGGLVTNGAGTCCDVNAKTCQTAAANGALTCVARSFFTANAGATDGTGTCTPSGCPANTNVAADGSCAAQCFYNDGQHLKLPSATTQVASASTVAGCSANCVAGGYSGSMMMYTAYDAANPVICTCYSGVVATAASLGSGTDNSFCNGLDATGASIGSTDGLYLGVRYF